MSLEKVTGHPDSLLGRTIVTKQNDKGVVNEVRRTIVGDGVKVKEEWHVKIIVTRTTLYTTLTYPMAIPLDNIAGIVPLDRKDAHLRKAMEDGKTIVNTSGAQWRLIDGKPAYFHEGRWNYHSIFPTIEKLFEYETDYKAWCVAKEDKTETATRYAYTAEDGRIIYFVSTRKGDKYMKRRHNDYNDAQRWGGERAVRARSFTVERAAQFDEVVGGCSCQK